MKKILIVFSLVSFLLMVGYGCHYAKKVQIRPTTQQLHTNKLALQAKPAPQLLAPDFTLPNINGNMFRLSDHKGHIIVLNYWATYCKPCVDEIPDFMNLMSEYKKEGVLFVGISISLNKVKNVRAFAKKMNINYPILIDKNNIFAKKYQSGEMAAPMTFIINHRGELAYVINGETTKKLLEPLIVKLINLSHHK